MYYVSATIAMSALPFAVAGSSLNDRLESSVGYVQAAECQQSGDSVSCMWLQFRNTTLTEQKQPAIEENPRAFRGKDAKLDKEFDYLLFDLGDHVELKLVRIYARNKSFKIGSPKNEEGRFKDEDQQQVILTQDFFLGVFEVTQKQFGRFVAETKYKTDEEIKKLLTPWNWRNAPYPTADSHPVNFISWNDARRFCEWLTKKATRKVLVRLPGEVEWEFACRAGSAGRFHFGDNPEDLAKYDNVADLSYRKLTGEEDGIKSDDGFGYTAPVGSYKPNAFGLYDMHGNVSELCEDSYGKYADLPKTNNQIQTQKSHRHVIRGGCWCSQPLSCRSANRLFDWSGYANLGSGFRIVVLLSDTN